MRTKLRMDKAFIRDEVGKVEIRQNKDPKSKLKDEVTVRFETKEIRDAIKGQASNLANYDDSGMRLHVPNHLQKDFKALMGLAYDLKKNHANLRRNVKFDEEDLGLFMDMQMDRDGPWRRVKPAQARRALALSGKAGRSGPEEMDADEFPRRRRQLHSG